MSDVDCARLVGRGDALLRIYRDPLGNVDDGQVRGVDHEISR